MVNHPAVQTDLLGQINENLEKLVRLNLGLMAINSTTTPPQSPTTKLIENGKKEFEQEMEREDMRIKEMLVTDLLTEVRAYCLEMKRKVAEIEKELLDMNKEVKEMNKELKCIHAHSADYMESRMWCTNNCNWSKYKGKFNV